MAFFAPDSDLFLRSCKSKSNPLESGCGSGYAETITSKFLLLRNSTKSEVLKNPLGCCLNFPSGLSPLNATNFFTPSFAKSKTIFSKSSMLLLTRVI